MSRWERPYCGRSPPGSWVAMLGLAGVTAGLWGCAPRGRTTLFQPDAPPQQREVTLQGDWCFTATDGGRRQSFLAFPLPGAKDGPRDFLIYLTTPAYDGDHAVDASQAGAARGFLIQCVGLRAGKTEFAAGVVRVRSVTFGGERRKVQIDVRCEDQTHVRGEALLQPDTAEVRAFERRYAQDVARLKPPEPPAPASAAPIAAADAVQTGSNGPEPQSPESGSPGSAPAP